MWDVYIFQPEPGSPGLIVVFANGQVRTYASRMAAMNESITRCRAAELDGTASTSIHVQGSDGQWRSFDSRLLPIPADMLPPQLHERATEPTT